MIKLVLILIGFSMGPQAIAKTGGSDCADCSQCKIKSELMPESHPMKGHLPAHCEYKGKSFHAFVAPSNRKVPLVLGYTKKDGYRAKRTSQANLTDFTKGIERTEGYKALTSEGAKGISYEYVDMPADMVFSAPTPADTKKVISFKASEYIKYQDQLTVPTKLNKVEMDRLRKLGKGQR